MDCSICLNQIKGGAEPVAASPCGHIFHEECLFRWLEHSTSRDSCCPQCRQSIQKRKITRLYLPSTEDDEREKQLKWASMNLEHAQTEISALQSRLQNSVVKERELQAACSKLKDQIENQKPVPYKRKPYKRRKHWRRTYYSSRANKAAAHFLRANAHLVQVQNNFNTNYRATRRPTQTSSTMDIINLDSDSDFSQPFDRLHERTHAQQSTNLKLTAEEIVELDGITAEMFDDEF